MSARQLSKESGTSRGSAQRWLRGEQLSPRLQSHLDAVMRRRGCLIASDFLNQIDPARHGEARGLLERFAEHFEIDGVVHEINGQSCISNASSVQTHFFKQELIAHK